MCDCMGWAVWDGCGGGGWEGRGVLCGLVGGVGCWGWEGWGGGWGGSEVWGGLWVVVWGGGWGVGGVEGVGGGVWGVGVVWVFGMGWDVCFEWYHGGCAVFCVCELGDEFEGV